MVIVESTRETEQNYPNIKTKEYKKMSKAAPTHTVEISMLFQVPEADSEKVENAIRLITDRYEHDTRYMKFPVKITETHTGKLINGPKPDMSRVTRNLQEATAHTNAFQKEFLRVLATELTQETLSTLEFPEMLEFDEKSRKYSFSPVRVPVVMLDTEAGQDNPKLFLEAYKAGLKKVGIN